MRRLAVIVLFVAACDSKESPSPAAPPPPPTCDQVIDRANELYVASKAGKELGTQQDVARSMNIHHVCEQMTPDQRRCVMAAKTIGATDDCKLPVAPEPERAKPLAKDLTCQEVGEAWSDYVHNRNRKNKDWADIASDQQSDCERNDWPQPERQCWAAITDVASHQRCLDDFYKPRTAKHPSKPPPPDPEDAFFEQDESDE